MLQCLQRLYSCESQINACFGLEKEKRSGRGPYT